MTGPAKRPWGLLMLVGLLVVFFLAVVELMLLRFDRGDVLPPYSSLRADPLGTRAWHDSLENMGRPIPARHHRDLQRLENPAGTTVLILGAELRDLFWPGTQRLAELDYVPLSGGRLVLAFYPISKPSFGQVSGLDEDVDQAEDQRKKKEIEQPDRRRDKTLKNRPEDRPPVRDDQVINKPDRSKDKTEPGKKARAGSVLEKLPREFKVGTLTRHWNMDYGFFPDWDAHKGAVARGPEGASAVSWHSALYFRELGPGWRVLYQVRGRPVIIERSYGPGSIVLASDSYFASNEALRAEARPELLAALIGSSSRVIFDESHLGIEEDPGVAGLARKYGLHGLLAGLMVLALLFAWKNGRPLVPARDEEDDGTDLIVSRRDYTAGLVSLLKRNVPPTELLALCYREWRAHFASEYQRLGDTLNRAEATVRIPKLDPVQGYGTIARLLAEGKKTWKQAPNP